MAGGKSMEHLAKEYNVVYKSFDPSSLFCYSPAIVKLASGRLVVSIDIRDVNEERKKTGNYDNWYKENQRSWWLGKVFVSDDNGKTWVHKTDFPFLHARPFVCGKRIYILGHSGDLRIMYSDDDGETWSESFYLTKGQTWHQAPCNVVYANGCVYLVMERVKYDTKAHWKVKVLAPVLMRGKVEDDLTKPENWTFANEIAYCDLLSDDKLNYFGIPFYKCDEDKTTDIGYGRKVAPCGWLETNVVQFKDPRHIWYDEKGKTFHLFARTHTGWTGHAALLKVVEKDDGSMETMVEKVPSGKDVIFVNMPGGQMKFHILYDEVTKLYWLLGSQSTDSMVSLAHMGKDRFDIPNNERHRLVLHFSKNCIDWCFAGVVDIGDGYKQSRHYASMCIDDEDLCIVSRSGDEDVYDAHDTNLITFHRVKNFRNLVY
jgi:hypothetical protein